jgi:hypothetical protein
MSDSPGLAPSSDTSAAFGYQEYLAGMQQPYEGEADNTMREELPSQEVRVVVWPLEAGTGYIEAKQYWDKHPVLPTLDNGWRLEHYYGYTYTIEAEE